MLKGFRDFILRGNVVDLAVAVIIGAAFGAITSSLTADVITPLISALVGTPDFSSLVLHLPVLHSVAPPHPLPANYIPPGENHIGKLHNAMINNLIVASHIYYLVVVPIARLLVRMGLGPAAAIPVKSCDQCLSEIPLAATRCKFCAQPA